MLSKQAKYYMSVQFIYTVGLSLSNLFIGVFLWKINESLMTLAIFYLIESLVVLTSFSLCGFLARKTSPLFTLQIGLITYAISYGSLLIFNDQAGNIYWMIGFLNGLATSFVAIGTHIFSMDTTKNINRDKFMNYSQMLGSISGIGAPFLSGNIITFFGGAIGYYYIFFLTAVILSFKIEQKPLGDRSYLKEIVLKPSFQWKRLMKATFLWGSIDGLYRTFLFSMIMYQILQDEWWMGTLSTLASIIGLGVSIFYAKIMNQGNRHYFYLFGAVLLFVSSTLLSISPVFLTLVIFLIVSSFANPAINIPINTRTYEVIESEPNFELKRLDFIVSREIPLGLGRSVSIMLFMLFHNFFAESMFIFIVFSIVSGVYLVAYPLIVNKKTSSSQLALRDTFPYKF